jgi:hypothetical protein
MMEETMTDEAYERLLGFLAADDIPDDPPVCEDGLEDVVAEAALILADLRAAAGDPAGAAIWRQVSKRAAGEGAEHVPALREHELLPGPPSRPPGRQVILQHRKTSAGRLEWNA